MQRIVRQVCQYLDITQIVTGGHKPRGNAICERVNQTLGSMIRKLSDLDYKDLKNFLPSFEFILTQHLVRPPSASRLRSPMVYQQGRKRKHESRRSVLDEGQRTQRYWKMFHQYLTEVL